MPPKPFLKKGQGKLASQNHGQTEFALNRQRKIREEYNNSSKKYITNDKTIVLNEGVS